MKKSAIGGFLSRSVQLLIGFLSGAALGLLAWACFRDSSWLAPLIANVMQPIGQIFLRLIFLAVVPLVFSSLVICIFEMNQFRTLGRISIKALLYTFGSSACAVSVGLILASWLKPGFNMDPSFIAIVKDKSQADIIIEHARSVKSFAQIVVELIPKNPIEMATKATEGEMLSLIVFSLIFGAALLSVKSGRQGDPLVRAIEGVRDVSTKMIDFAMRLAPIGIFALTFVFCAEIGWHLLANLSKYVGVVLLGLGIQQVVVYGIVLAIFARKSIWVFLQETKEVTLTAFATASSTATLPVSLRVSEHHLRLNKQVSQYVVTMGTTANQTGTALFGAVTVIFLAQVYGIPLSNVQYFVLTSLCILTGVITAGVPGGSLPLIAIVLYSVGIPLEGLGLILGIDRFLDMCRTTLNVSGDLVAATIIDATESESSKN